MCIRDRPYDIEQQRKETKEMMDDLTNRDQRMMFGLVTMAHLAAVSYTHLDVYKRQNLAKGPEYSYGAFSAGNINACCCLLYTSRCV